MSNAENPQRLQTEVLTPSYISGTARVTVCTEEGIAVANVPANTFDITEGIKQKLSESREKIIEADNAIRCALISRNILFSRSDMSPLQESAFLIMISRMQKWLVSDCRDLFNMDLPAVFRIDVNKLEYDRPAKAKLELAKLKSKSIDFIRKIPGYEPAENADTALRKTAKKVPMQFTGLPITSRVDINTESPYVFIQLNPELYPYLLYTGLDTKGTKIGATMLPVEKMLKLKTTFERRLFAICMDCSDNKGVSFKRDISLILLYDLLCLDSNHRKPSHLRTRYLDKFIKNCEEIFEIYISYVFLDESMNEVAPSRMTGPSACKILRLVINKEKSKGMEKQTLLTELFERYRTQDELKLKENPWFYLSNPEAIDNLYNYAVKLKEKASNSNDPDSRVNRYNMGHYFNLRMKDIVNTDHPEKAK